LNLSKKPCWTGRFQSIWVESSPPW
jgi:hypothetical protein